jgi:HEAT repeat protein
MTYSDELNELPDRQDVIALLEKSRDRSSRDGAIEELRSLDRKRILDILSDLLVSPDLDLRDSAIKVLMTIDPHQGVDLIIPLLRDPLDSWRWYLCGALADYGDERAVLPLTEVLLHDTDSDTRYMAAFALEKIGDTRALPALRHALDHDSGTDYEGRSIDELAAEAIQSILKRGAAEAE